MPLLKKKNSRNRAQDFFLCLFPAFFIPLPLRVSILSFSLSPLFLSFFLRQRGGEQFIFILSAFQSLLFPNIFRIINSLLVHLHFSGIHVWWEVCFLSLLLGGTHFTKLIRQNPTSPSSASQPPTLPLLLLQSSREKTKSQLLHILPADFGFMWKRCEVTGVSRSWK